MTRVDLSNSIAAEMDKVLNSEENKQMFSSSSVLEKLAFNRVADEGRMPSEVEDELNKQSLQKTAASSCKCEKKHGSDKKCDCPSDCSCHESKSKSAEIVSTLLKVSEDLENNGFEKLAALSIVLAEKLVVEAKEKSKSKKDEKSSKSKSDKASKKKMTMKERMEKMRKMQKGKGKKSDKKSKKSSLTVELTKRGQIAGGEQAKYQAGLDNMLARNYPQARGQFKIVSVIPSQNDVGVGIAYPRNMQGVYDKISGPVSHAIGQISGKNVSLTPHVSS